MLLCCVVCWLHLVLILKSEIVERGLSMYIYLVVACLSVLYVLPVCVCVNLFFVSFNLLKILLFQTDFWQCINATLPGMYRDNRYSCNVVLCDNFSHNLLTLAVLCGGYSHKSLNTFVAAAKI